jgi:hypothetical protein
MFVVRSTERTASAAWELSKFQEPKQYMSDTANTRRRCVYSAENKNNTHYAVVRESSISRTCTCTGQGPTHTTYIFAPRWFFIPNPRPSDIHITPVPISGARLSLCLPLPYPYPYPSRTASSISPKSPTSKKDTRFHLLDRTAIRPNPGRANLTRRGGSLYVKQTSVVDAQLFTALNTATEALVPLHGRGIKIM